jgi:hypothetical protein
MEKSSLQQAWENGRELIRQENDLVNHRLTGWLYIQGFMFTALVVCAVSFAADSSPLHKACMAVFMLAVTIGGFVSARQIYPAIRAAYRQVNATKIWWENYLKETKIDNGESYRDACQFPPIVGKRAKTLRPRLRFEKLSEDEAYPELKLDDAALKKLDDDRAFGIPELIALFAWLWFIFFITTIIMIVAFFASYILEKDKTITTIIIQETPVSGDVSISYKGNIDKLPELEKRIGGLRRMDQTTGRSAKP